MDKLYSIAKKVLDQKFRVNRHNLITYTHYNLKEDYFNPTCPQTFNKAKRWMVSHLVYALYLEEPELSKIVERYISELTSNLKLWWRDSEETVTSKLSTTT